MISSTKELCVYQFKITLKNIKPPVWRRLLVRSDSSLGQFHEIVQAAVGWMDCHLHQFVIDGQLYGPQGDLDSGLSMFDEMESMDEAKHTLADFPFREKEKFQYEYDFGDGWEHKIVLEKILPYTLGETVPKCMTGRRGCPPEDVGGVWGYQEFLEIYKDTTHPEHERMVEWAGEYFYPECFDPAEINEIFSGEG